ncbi:MAG TPA: hypothetical protein VEA80_09445 [Vitreimonas sp.]|uniref:hypothetical protein n=1 Tax=Vitreimonas sp. TaxID=3069702 RepID=UPI002D46CF54|nr:hypothetical protein [Vitreimonas sp.]HYD87687.1 hypothetical protein [Vitreimonas sp.]
MRTRLVALAAFAALAPFTVALAQSALPTPVETSALQELDAWSVSAVARGEGALPADLWSRSDPAFLAAAFDKLPAAYDSPATLALARRVLFSGGEAPRGDAQAAGRQRFEAIGRMGAADQLAQLVAGAGASATDPIIAQYGAQAELARGQRNAACSRGRSAAVGETAPPFLLRLRAYCAAASGDRAAADLALELARAQNADDAWYTGAVAAAGGAPGARPPAARWDNSLSVQLSLAGQLRAGPNPLNNASTLALVALARNEQTPQPHRAQAAALAFRRGALSVQETRTILGATPAEISSALPPIVTAMRRITAARATAAAPATPVAAGAAPAVDPAALEAAAAIAEVLRQASAPADFHAAARFFRDEINALPAAPDQAAALLFARAAIANGDTQVAQRLVTSARQAGAAEAALAPLDAALAVMTGVRGEQATMAMQRRIDAGGASGARAAARDVSILAALGAPVSGPVQTFVLSNAPQGGARADTGAMLALAAAVERGAVGEGALLAAAALGQGGPAALDAESLERIIRALRALRLEDDARRIAVEALLAGTPS